MEEKLKKAVRRYEKDYGIQKCILAVFLYSDQKVSTTECSSYRRQDQGILERSAHLHVF